MHTITRHILYAPFLLLVSVASLWLACAVGSLLMVGLLWLLKVLAEAL